MNKIGFINELSKQLDCDLDYARKINDLLEDNFIIGKKNKEKTINHFMEELNIDEEKANHIYNVCSSIIATAIKNKIKHPFKDLDK